MKDKIIKKRESFTTTTYFEIEYKVDQEYCVHEYWLDFARKDKVKIDKIKILSKEEKRKIRNGETVSKPARGGSYQQYFNPYLIGIDQSPTNN